MFTVIVRMNGIDIKMKGEERVEVRNLDTMFWIGENGIARRGSEELRKAICGDKRREE